MVEFARSYSVFIVIYALFTMLMILASPHGLSNIDTDLVVVAFGSLILFPATGIGLFHAFDQDRFDIRKSYIIIILLVLTGLVFVYYTYQLWTNEYVKEKSFYHYVPIVAIVATSILIRGLIKKIKRNRVQPATHLKITE